MTASIAVESVKLSQSAPVELYVIDLAPLSGPVYRFCPQTNELGAAVVWQGLTYTTFPIEADGFAARAMGSFPRPRLRAGNAAQSLGALIRDYDHLRGARLTRKRTMARYLDAVNFAAGNAGADPYACYPDELWLVDRCSSRNRLFIEWELCNPLDFIGIGLPGRTVQANWCPWRYRSSDCGYAGAPVAKIDDSPTTFLSEDRCSKRLSGCKLRFGANGELPFGGFPGVGQVRQV